MMQARLAALLEDRQATDAGRHGIEVIGFPLCNRACPALIQAAIGCHANMCLELEYALLLSANGAHLGTLHDRRELAGFAIRGPAPLTLRVAAVIVMPGDREVEHTQHRPAPGALLCSFHDRGIIARSPLRS